MHIPDGTLPGSVLAATSVIAAVGVTVGLHKMDYERTPRVGVLAAAFFVASLIHVPVGPSSVHLLLNGLLGFLLGWAAMPALAVALLVQAVLFGYGGITSLGANVVIMGLPAVACHYLFARRIRDNAASPRVFRLAFAAGAATILLTCIAAAAVLHAGGPEFAGIIRALVVGHLPIMGIEGFVTGSAVVCLCRVRPETFAAPAVAPAASEERFV